jgi:hypothetical protein
MIVIAGFEWLTAAGDSGKIKHAREKITNALIGLVLALGSYTILNTINPALLSLQLHPIKMVRLEDSFSVPYGKFCKVGRDDAACAAATPGAKCIPWAPVKPECSLAEAFAIAGVGIATTALGGTAVAEIAGIAGGASASLNGIMKAGKYIYGKIGLGGVVMITGGTYVYKNIDGWIGEPMGTNEPGNGMCLIPERDTNFMRPGEACSSDAECMSGKCSSLYTCSPIAGVCVDGGKNSPCWIGGTLGGSTPPPEARNLVCNTGLQCIRIRTAGGTTSNQHGMCSDQSWGFRCDNGGSTCADGTWCSRYYGICIKSESAQSNGCQDCCRTDYDCIGDQQSSVATKPVCLIQRSDGRIQAAGTIPLSGDLASLAPGTCTARSEGSTCTPNVGGGGISSCSGTNVCIPFQLAPGANPGLPANICEQPSSLDEVCDINNSNTCRSQLLCAAILPVNTTRGDGQLVIVSSVCKRMPGAPCADRTDCYGSNSTCINSLCQLARCTSNANCGASEVCDVSSGACLMR